MTCECNAEMLERVKQRVEEELIGKCKKGSVNVAWKDAVLNPNSGQIELVQRVSYTYNADFPHDPQYVTKRHREVPVKISFCPFCGRKLKGKTK